MITEQRKETAMLKFETFNLPTDGLTRLSEIGRYSSGDSLWRDGWTMVGICVTPEKKDDEPKLYGVFRKVESEALRDALATAEKTTEEKNKSDEAKNESERQLKDAHKRLASLTEIEQRAIRQERVIGHLRDKFGSDAIKEGFELVKAEENAT